MASTEDTRNSMSGLTLLRHRVRKTLRKWSIFWTVKVVQVICVIYIFYFTAQLYNPATKAIDDPNSAERTKDGVILINGDLRPVVAETPFQLFCLAVSRASAFSMYPVLILVLLSKCRATCNILYSSPISMYMFKDMHELHEYAGHYIAFDAWIHTLFHLLRWGTHGNISLLWTHPTGITGLLAVVVAPLITFVMMYFKKSIRYEIRKGLHYLFYVFILALCWHVPVSGIPNGGFIAPVLGFCIALYVLDSIYVHFYMAEKIETTVFQVIPSGVQMTMKVSKRFQSHGANGGFAYVCLPWVDRNQWHAFSLYENPRNASERQVFMAKAGDWTTSVHEALQRHTVRPVWVQGPFISPYNNAVAYDNQILVASGIGITPALSVMRAHRDSRRINLIWILRDAAMLEFYLTRWRDLKTPDWDGWNIVFYTGKTPLNPALYEFNDNVHIICGRPDLPATISNIIYGIESGAGLPETFLPDHEADVKQMLCEKLQTLDESDMSATEKVQELTAFAQGKGFIFSMLLDPLEITPSCHGPSGLPKVVSGQNLADLDKSEGSATSDEVTVDIEGPLLVAESRRAEKILAQLRRAMPSCGPSPRRGSSITTGQFPGYGNRRRSTTSITSPKGDQLKSSIFSSSTHGLSRNRNSNDRQVRDADNISPKGTIQKKLEVMDPKEALLSLSRIESFTPWDADKAVSMKYIKEMSRADIDTWGLLYCGGSRPVEKALKGISQDYHIDLNVESFAW